MASFTAPLPCITCAQLFQSNTETKRLRKSHETSRVRAMTTTRDVLQSEDNSHAC